MIETSLIRIEDWLIINAENISKHSLQKPATDIQLHELENRIGKDLPQDFKQLYKWHNGMNDIKNVGSLFYGMDFMPIKTIISDHENRIRVLEKIKLNKVDKEIDASNIFNPFWIQFGFDGARTGLYIDLSPTPDGNYGQIIFIDDEYSVGIFIARSVTEFIDSFQIDLENGLYSLDIDAMEDHNHFLVADQSIDIINWEHSKRWKR